MLQDIKCIYIIITPTLKNRKENKKTKLRQRQIYGKGKKKDTTKAHISPQRAI